MPVYYSKIHVQKKNGDKLKKAKVCLSFSGIFSGGLTKIHYTDSEGTALVAHESRGTAKIIINGSTKGEFKAPGETVVFV